jgi:ABC-type enterochelin transport system permease subunit
MWAYIFTFLSMLVTDIVYTQLLKSVQNDKPFAASIWASLITFLGGVAIINYTSDNKMIIPAVLGAFVGTYIGMKYHIGDKIESKGLQ